MSENIILDYSLMIYHGMGEDLTGFYAPKGATFFQDEHGIQWVKFISFHGHNPGKEHMLRTDCAGFLIVRS